MRGKSSRTSPRIVRGRQAWADLLPVLACFERQCCKHVQVKENSRVLPHANS